MVQHVDLTGRPTNCKSRRRYNGTTPGNRRQHATTLGAYGMLHCARHMPVHAELEEQVPEDVRRTVDFPPAVGRPAYFHVLCYKEGESDSPRANVTFEAQRAHQGEYDYCQEEGSPCWTR